jgi:hypothetical protein
MWVGLKAKEQWTPLVEVDCQIMMLVIHEF